jgi:protein-S-isoprenylcysteine O-methyltransferase Ste14
MSVDIEKHRYAIEKCLNILSAFIYIVFAATFAKDLIHNHRLSSFFPVVMVSFFVYFFLIRDLPRQLNLSPYDWLISLNGTFLPLCLRPAPLLHDSFALIILQSVGVCVSMAGILSLNKSIGLAPANRGIKTFWAYKYVRHPIYAGYFISLGAYCAQNLTAVNVIVTLLWMTCESLRMFAEEKYLSADDPAYVAYMKKVRWRLVPYVF